MKKILLSAALLVAAIVCKAQSFVKGDMLVGGSMCLSVTAYQESSSTYLSFIPEFDYFVADNINVGAAMSFSATAGFNNFYFMPKASYVMQFGENWGLSHNLYVGMGTEGGGNVTWKAFYSPSVYCRMTDHWFLNATVGKLGYNGGEKHFDFDLGSLLVGVAYKF